MWILNSISFWIKIKIIFEFSHFEHCKVFRNLKSPNSTFSLTKFLLTFWAVLSQTKIQFLFQDVPHRVRASPDLHHRQVCNEWPQERRHLERHPPQDEPRKQRESVRISGSKLLQDCPRSTQRHGNRREERLNQKRFQWSIYFRGSDFISFTVDSNR